MNLKQIKVAKDNTHHLYENKPLYNKRFIHVLKFHPPGLAPVLDKDGAYHITVDGKAAYDKRFHKTFGFYFEKAAVITESGWGHIDTKGDVIYKPIFAWVGNYQENIVTVRNTEGYYFHIDHLGNRLYEENMMYAGDFRDGMAVIRNKNGFCTHININGDFVHNKFYIDLDVYHKGFARARDEKGWFHVDIDGVPSYSERFQMVEPFYNEFALAEDFQLNKIIIDQEGNIVHRLKKGK